MAVYSSVAAATAGPSVSDVNGVAELGVETHDAVDGAYRRGIGPAAVLPEPVFDLRSGFPGTHLHVIAALRLSFQDREVLACFGELFLGSDRTMPANDDDTA